MFAGSNKGGDHEVMPVDIQSTPSRFEKIQK